MGTLTGNPNRFSDNKCTSVGPRCQGEGGPARIGGGRLTVGSRLGPAIVSPLGDVLAGPLYDREGTLYADLDLGEIARGRFDLDVTGHYARPDILQLIVDERPRPPVVYRGGEVL